MNPGDPPPPVPAAPAVPAGAFAPPTAPGRLTVPDRPAQWPSVLGIICSILGGLAATGAVFGIIMQIVLAMGGLDKLLSAIQGVGTTTTVNTMGAAKDHAVLLLAVEVFKLALAVLLLVAGLGIASCRPRGIPLAKTWAILKIVLTFVATAIGIWVQQDALRATFNGSNVPPGASAAMPNIMLGGAIVGGVIGIVWGCALPAFVLVWLHRAAVKAEIARWQRPAF